MLKVLIAGGGPAALEAALRLDRLAGDRVSTTLLAPDTDFTYRPLSVLEPFAAGAAWDYPLARLAADAHFVHRLGALVSVDPGRHEAETDRGELISYDALLVAAGAIPIRPRAGAVAFTGSAADVEALHGLIQDVEGGYTRSVAFVVPAGVTWPLPLYELALMLAERAFESNLSVDLRLVTPELAPLALFGPQASAEVEALLRSAGVSLHTGTTDHDAERTVTLATLAGPGIPGLPADANGFLVTDDHGRVTGAPGVFAAGDVTAYPVKQGGLACQQADAAAEQIAALAGATIEPEPFRPVLRGMLLTERWARVLRRDTVDVVAGRALWWPPTKIAGRELAGYLHALDEELGHVRGRPVEAAMPA